MAASEISGNSGEMEDQMQNFLDKLVFLESPWKLRNFQCNHCNRIAMENAITNCADLLCQKCYQIFENLVCPVCKKCTIISKTTDANLKEDILNLKVECLNRKHGCQNILRLITFLEHYKQCEFTPGKMLEQSKISGFEIAKEEITCNFEKYFGNQFGEFKLEMLTTLMAVKGEMNKFKEEVLEEMRKLREEMQMVKEEQKNTSDPEKKKEKNPKRPRSTSDITEILENCQLVRSVAASYNIKSCKTINAYNIDLITIRRLERGSYASQPFCVKESGIKIKVVAELDEDQVLVLHLVVLEGEPWELKSHMAEIVLLDQSESENKQNVCMFFTSKLTNNRVCQFDFGAKLSSPSLPRTAKFLQNGTIKITIIVTYDSFAIVE